MDDFIYFIKKFIMKERQARWLYFVSHKNQEKLYRELYRLDNSLNKQKCVLVHEHAYDIAGKLISEKKINKGIYMGFDPTNGYVYTFMKPIDLDKVWASSLLICRDEKISFYFHHEGCIWICQEK
jgi:hypothetical protein